MIHLALSENWLRTGDKPLPEPMITRFIDVYRPTQSRHVYVRIFINIIDGWWLTRSAKVQMDAFYYLWPFICGNQFIRIDHVVFHRNCNVSFDPHLTWEIYSIYSGDPL